MNSNQPDWVRLHKAIAVEAERGFNNVQGKHHQFHEFLYISLNDLLNIIPKSAQNRCQTLVDDFAHYSEKTRQERENILDDTRRFLLQIEREINHHSKVEEITTKSKTPPASLPVSISNPSPIQTKPLVEKSPNAASSLEQALSKVVGPRNADRLAKLGLYTVYDLLYYYPRDHIDYARQVAIRDLVPGETVTLVAKVKRCSCFSSPKNKKLTILDLTLTDNTGKLKISRFFAGPRFSNPGWQNKQKYNYPPGTIIAASGLVKSNKYGITLDNPELEILDQAGSEIDSMKIGRVVPVYPLSEGVGADLIRKTVLSVLPTTRQLQDSLPQGLLKLYQLIGIQDAIQNIHFPPDRDCLAAARRRLVFDEFFYLQLGLLKRRQSQKKATTTAVLAPTGKLIEQFHEILPFKFTNAQERVVKEILIDLQSSEPMNRLVQGDVGAGKTVVAVVAMLAAIQAGYQAALMAPTEVLAEQHYRKLVSWFNLMHLSVELLTGSTKTAKRREIHKQLETGELPVLVGTHALIQDTVNFHRLGLVVIDEQHRFGVQQRARLQQKGDSPHVLTMTATPIPRTLALTLHGDLDVSQLDELPPGRQPIQTTILMGRQRNQAYDLMRREIVQGRQAYVVLPLVEESEKLDVRSAVEEHQKLQNKIFPEFQIGLLHGRLSSAEKDEAICEFRDQKTQILVSTTVVEVGVDVPNATVMLIENAERFGLSQLHQLRGRVGRGEHKSYCLLMAGGSTPEAKERLQVLEQSQDGFFIAEMDMQLRGPGQVLGTRQSGLPDFVLASLVEDQEVLELARDAAQKAIEKDETLDRWPLMQEELNRRFQKMLGGSILT